MLKKALRELRQLRRLTIVLLFSPLLVDTSLSIAKDYFCVWSSVKDPYRVIWFALGTVVASSALIELNREDTLKLVGHDPVFGTNLFALSFLSLNINGVLSVVFGLLYWFIRILVGAPCAP
jgi:hypothetical protein